MQPYHQDPVLLTVQHIMNLGFDPNYQIPIRGSYGFDTVAAAYGAMDRGVPPWDYLGLTNPDANNNYQTLTFKSGGSGGTPVRTFNLTFDGSSNVTSLTKS